MHLPDGQQLDLSTQVAKVKAKTRPWKAIIAIILAICAAAASGWAHNRFQHFLGDKEVPYQILAIGLAVAFCALASIATLDLSSKAQAVLEPSAGPSHAAIVRYALMLVGAVTTLIITLGLLGIPIGQLVLGGALTSVFVGIAAQQSLSNVFAGIVLMLAHPFRVGDGIRLQAGALGGQVSGTIVEVGITYVRIASSTGVLSIPNSQVLNSIIGPLPEPAGNDPQAPPPVMALPAVQPTPPGPPGPPPMDTRIVSHVRLPDPQPGDPQPGDGGAGDGQDADSHPEVPAGTPEPRPSGTPT
ncbi:MAG TPA: mechanosensitive ion channel family protein [Streptosporangiaceae bacterium]|nr:mechanosensitive ion channel family protein [Streptosporangiaceae bacterium]